MVVTSWPLERILPFARNPRKIPPEAIDKVALSIKEFGWRVPIVVDKAGVIICGHTRLLAARKLGLTEAPVHVADNLSPAQVRAYRLLDNRSHEESRWDKDRLELELLDLKGMEVDLNLTGFNTDEIDLYLANADCGTRQNGKDLVPEVPREPVSARGDLWVLGSHRLLCGEATSAASYQTLLAGRQAAMTFTNLQYGVPYLRKAKKKSTLQNHDQGSQWGIFLREAFQHLLAVTKGAVYICLCSSELDDAKQAFAAAGGYCSTILIWVEKTLTRGRSDYQRQYELVLYGWKEGSAHYWCGARDQGDVWFNPQTDVGGLPPQMKPVEWIERAILNSSQSRTIVLDPFAGPGSTLIGCEETGRQARLIESDPRCADTAVVRWQNFTGTQAVLEGDGRSFREIAEKRRGAVA